MLPRALILFVLAFATQASQAVGSPAVAASAVEGEMLRWAVQSGSFAVFFVVTAAMAVRWLGKVAVDSKNQSISILDAQVRASAELSAKTLLLLDRVEGVLIRYERSLEHIENTMQRMETERSRV